MGPKVLSCEFNSYGNVRDYQGLSNTDCPFRYAGMYEDRELGGLYYNRFRYYSPEEGIYMKGQPPLTTKQRKVVNNNKTQIRKANNRIYGS